MDDHDVAFLGLIALAILLPPLAVALKSGGLGFHFWLNLALTFFGFWIPGVVHAIWFVFSGQPVQ